MSKLQDITLIKELKELILDQVRALYGHKYPTHTFAVLTSRFNAGSAIIDIEYNAQAIVYTRPQSLSEWKLLVEGDTGRSTVAAMELIYPKLQSKVDEVTGKMGEGWVWNGAKARDPGN